MEGIFDNLHKEQPPEDWSLFEDVFIIATGERQASIHKHKSIIDVGKMFIDRHQFNATWRTMNEVIGLRQHLREEGKWGAPYIPQQKQA